MTQPAFDPARYPRTYTASTRRRATWWLLGGGTGVAGLAMFLDEVLGHTHGDASRSPAPGVGWLLMSVLGFAALVRLLRARVIVAAHAIEARGFGTWRLRREDIVDYRVRVHCGMRAFRLRSKLRRRPFTFTQAFEADDAFVAWFASLVDSDGRDRQDALQRIMRDDTLGATPALRLEPAGRARHATRWLLLPCHGVAFWTLLRAQPGMAALVLTAIQPVIALALAWRFDGLFTLASSRRPTRADLSPLLIMPGCALTGRALMEASLSQPTSLIAPALAAGAVLAALAVTINDDLRTSRLQAIGTAFVLTLYAGSLLALANVRLDRTVPARAVAKVTAKRHTSGKGASAWLTLAGRPGHAEPADYRVPDSLYRRVAVGDGVCVVEHPGAFGWRWTAVDDASSCGVP